MWHLSGITVTVNPCTAIELGRLGAKARNHGTSGTREPRRSALFVRHLSVTRLQKMGKMKGICHPIIINLIIDALLTEW
jgi:hypothetical protein